MNIVEALSKELNLTVSQVEAAAALLDEGNTVPFISRYRKEVTGGMDDEVLRQFEQRLNYLRSFEKRKEEIWTAIDEQGKMTPEIEAMLNSAKILSELEDIYRPYRPKRRTRASVAKEKGLEPLADWILSQEAGEPAEKAAEFLNEQVETVEDALAGACDIIAEAISDTPQTRALLRALALGEGVIESCAAKEEDSTYRMYYEFAEPVKRLAGHRVLALDRGEKEEFLKVTLKVDEENALTILTDAFVKKNNACGALVYAAAEDAYTRLIFPSIEREIRSSLTERAADGAIRVFGANLKSLLMQPPIKGMVVMGLDPAYRTGCKIAVVDATGAVLDTTVVYPTPPQKRIEEAEKKLLALIKKYGVN
ncbi:MAG: RNA-binding transcriptional accessory protein, partial [Clostridia bacterium]|nr:RNA-binding transcriptional accessory protein [Clostridia bacterium]